MRIVQILLDEFVQIFPVIFVPNPQNNEITVVTLE
jgi:hypothetical protein